MIHDRGLTIYLTSKLYISVQENAFSCPRNTFRNILWYMKVETKYISLSFPVYSTYLAYISNIFWQKKKKKNAIWGVIHWNSTVWHYYTVKMEQSKEKHCHAIKCDCERFTNRARPKKNNDFVFQQSACLLAIDVKHEERISFTFLIAGLPRGLRTRTLLWKKSQIKLVKMTPISARGTASPEFTNHGEWHSVLFTVYL